MGSAGCLLPYKDIGSVALGQEIAQRQESDAVHDRADPADDGRIVAAVNGQGCIFPG